MPKTFEKTRKQIAKKRNGAVEALHKYSRDSKRLHRASVRDQRLEKLASSRSKKEQPMIDRAAFFQDAVKDSDESTALDSSQIQSLIDSFVHQYDEEYEDAKKARRPGRPPSAKQELLERKVKALSDERTTGFYLPDLTSPDNLKQLNRWDGSWTYLATVSWVRMSTEGNARPASFPPA